MYRVRLPLPTLAHWFAERWCELNQFALVRAGKVMLRVVVGMSSYTAPQPRIRPGLRLGPSTSELHHRLPLQFVETLELLHGHL